MFMIKFASFTKKDKEYFFNDALDNQKKVQVMADFPAVQLRFKKFIPLFFACCKICG